MKRYLTILALLVVLLPVFAGQYIIGTGTSTSNSAPFNGLYDYSWSKVIYTKAEINTAGLDSENDILSVAFNVGNTPSYYVMEDQRIYMRHTTVSAYDASDIAHPDNADFQLVFYGDITYNGSGWHHIIFNSPFVWNNVDNIEFLFENHNGNYISGYPSFLYTSSSPNYKVVQKPQDDSFPQGINGSRIYYRPNIQISTPMTEPPGVATNPQPATGTDYVNLDTLNLSWTQVYGADGYKLYLGTNPIPTEANDIGNVSSYQPTGLQHNTQYYWQVIPYNSFGDATDCPVWSFISSPEGIITIGNGTANNYLPASAYYGYSYSQSIFLQSEINMPDQRIEKIAYYWNGAGAGTNSNEWVVYMGHTDLESFGSTSAWLPLAGLTQVYAGTLSIPAVAGWIELELQNPFIYNNTQNLVIAVDENKPGYDSMSYFFFTTASPGVNRSIRYQNDSTNPDPAAPPVGTLVAAYPNILVQFGDLPEAPVFGYNPDAINFGTLVQNVPSAWQDVLISNTGIGQIELSVNNFNIVGSDAAMFEINAANLPANLSAGMNTNIPVRAVLTTEGDVSATLQIA